MLQTNNFLNATVFQIQITDLQNLVTPCRAFRWSSKSSALCHLCLCLTLWGPHPAA